MIIVINDLQKRIQLNPAKINKTACKISLPSRLSNLKLNLYFVKNSVIKRLNKQFFNRDCLTDVISFRLARNYAEVFIAPCVVKGNAVTFGVEFNEELYRCIVHGTLHIFGFKDEIKKEKDKMWKKQESLLKKIYTNAEN